MIESRRTRSYYHFSIGGELSIEESEDLERAIEKVTCRWCQATGGTGDFEWDNDESVSESSATNTSNESESSD